MPVCFASMLEHARNLEFEAEPDYKLILN